jgi:hypothetical protein
MLMVLPDMIQGSSPDAAFRCNRADCGNRVHQCFFPAADKAAGAFRRSRVMSLGYNEHIVAVGAISAQHGFEIKGTSGQMMCLFSSRRESITADLRARAAFPAAKRTRMPECSPAALMWSGMRQLGTVPGDLAQYL